LARAEVRPRQALDLSVFFGLVVGDVPTEAGVGPVLIGELRIARGLGHAFRLLVV
jgi:hypothetical protein